ncbi:MAG: zinc-dependent alcohol dehydrogenase family protein [Rhodobacterales bacterium]|nr:zinc-dependent alcohol dehydrogenase family protein [Rhodobacterales bacterium]
MKAAILHRFDSPFTVEEVPDPACPADGVIVEIRACGVCRSDHHAWKGVDPDVTLPHVLGHELAGVVVEVGRNCQAFRPGDRVTAPFILGCGHCADCMHGHPTICADQQVIGFTFWGAYAERTAIPAADFNLVRLPDSLDFVSAAGMGCRLTTSWRALTDRARLRPGEWLAVHGCGGVGLSAILIAAALGARVIAVDVSSDALEKAREMGANILLDASKVSSVGDAVRDLTGGGAHVSIDALGSARTYENSLRSLRKLGRHVQIGMPVGSHATVQLPLLELVYSRQLTLHGTRGLGAMAFGQLLDMIAGGRLDPARLVTRRIPLSQAHAALKEMDGRQPAGITVIDRMSV